MAWFIQAFLSSIDPAYKTDVDLCDSKKNYEKYKPEVSSLVNAYNKLSEIQVFVNI